MGFFGKKKSTAEILADGHALFEQGQYSRAVLTWLKASGKEKGEADYWVARGYLAQYDKKPDKGLEKLTKQFLKMAAKDGHEEAAHLLEERFGAAPEKE